MEDDISNFLPKYPNIHKNPNQLFNPYDDNFYKSLYLKKEFYDERLSKTEDFPGVIGGLMKHQKIITRFLSSRTKYDQILLLHSMGSGKTCTSIGAIEQIRVENSSFSGAMIFARGEGLLNNFINELVFKCTDGRYIPDDYENLTDMERVRRITKSTEGYYSLNTFETFAKEIKKLSDYVIEQRYSNKIIVIDEVHNLRLYDKDGNLSMYDEFYRFLHVVKNCKVILMSGTPMKDDPEEIAAIMNLILPIYEKLPVKDAFTAEFFQQEGDGLISVKPDKVVKLKNAFKGRVSYLSSMQTDVKKIFVGERIGKLKHFIVEEDFMGDFQSLHYGRAYERDEREKGVYSFSRQAILFVFPDGTYGPDGFNQDRYVKKTPRRKFGNKQADTLYNYSIGYELVDKLRGEDHEDMLNNLERYSSKYASTIREILRSVGERKSSFVYCEFVQGSGSILFASILKLFGFSKASGKEPEGSKGLRYALISNKTSTSKEIKTIVGRFNQRDNMNGEIISVIIGSRVIGEGFSLNNVQEENILTPHWESYMRISKPCKVYNLHIYFNIRFKTILYSING